MDGLRLQARALAQTLGCSTRRRTEGDIRPFGPQHRQDGIHQRRLADPGTAGDHQHLGRHGQPECLHLAVGQMQARLPLDPRDGLGDVDGRPGCVAVGEAAEPLGDTLFSPVEAREKDTAPPVQAICDDVAALQFQIEGGADQRRWDLQQLDREGRQLLQGEPAVPLVHGLAEGVADPCPHPDGRRELYTELLGDGVGRAEANAADVARQAVRVLADHLDGVCPIGLVDAHRAGGSDPIGVEEQHDLPDHLLLCPTGDDFVGALGTDAGHFPQAVRLLLDQIEHRGTERPHQPLGVDRPDSADHARPEVTLDPVQGSRRTGFEEIRLELQPMGAVIDPDTTDLHPLAGRDRGGVGGHRHQIAAARLHPQDAEAIVLVVERHPLHQSGEGLDRR